MCLESTSSFLGVVFSWTEIATIGTLLSRFSENHLKNFLSEPLSVQFRDLYICISFSSCCNLMFCSHPIIYWIFLSTVDCKTVAAKGRTHACSSILEHIYQKADFVCKNLKPKGENQESAMCLIVVAHLSVFVCVSVCVHVHGYRSECVLYLLPCHVTTPFWMQKLHVIEWDAKIIMDGDLAKM
jgi:hypothetical protein